MVMKRNMRNFNRRIEGVSEVIATILLITTSVVLVSIVGLYLTSLPEPVSKLNSNLVASYSPSTGMLVIEHRGGEAINAENLFVRILKDGATVEEYPITDGNLTGGDYIWEMGETWSHYLDPSIGEDVTVQLLDKYGALGTAGAILMSQDITLSSASTSVPDIEVRNNGISLGSTDITERESTSVSVKIFNAGDTTITERMYIRIIDTYGTESRTIDSIVYTPSSPLTPGDYFQVSTTWTPSALFSPCIGKHGIVVDIQPLAGEINVDNNRAVYYVYVRQYINATSFDAPDLAITSDNIDISPDYPEHGDEITISAYIVNYGDTAATADIIFYKGSVSLDPDTGYPTAPIPPVIGSSTGVYIKTSRTVSVSWTTNTGGTQEISVAIVNIVSEDSTKPETHFTNNNVTIDLYIKPTILLVGDDNATSSGSVSDSVNRMRDAISAIGYTYDYVYVSAGMSGPSYSTGANMLSNYDIVVWVCGYDSGSTLTSSDITNLESYLDNGGSLWLIGTNIYDDFSDGNPAGGMAFLRDYLGVGGLSANDVHPHRVAWANNSLINMSEVNYYTMDIIEPYNSSADVFDVYGSFAGTVEGILYDPYNSYSNISLATAGDSGYKSVFFSWDMSLLGNYSERAIITSKVMRWLGAALGPGIHDLAVSETEFSVTTPEYMQVVNISAVVQNNGEEDETNVVVGFYVDGELISRYPDGRDSLQTGLIIEAGGTLTVWKQWLATTVGEHTIKVVVDPYNYIDEISEVNNDITYSTLIDPTVNVGYNVLVVDDDDASSGPYNSTINITNALDTLGYNYEVVTVPSGDDGPPLSTPDATYGDVVLKNYNAIIWNCGGDSNDTLTLTDIQNLMDYLDGRYTEAQEFPDEITGHLFLLGGDIVNELLSPAYGSTGINFLKNYLHVNVSNPSLDSGLPSTIYGVYGDEITHGMEYPTMDEYPDKSDKVSPLSPAEGIFKAVGGDWGSDGSWVDFSPSDGRYSGVRYSESKYSVVFLPWDLSFLGNTNGSSTRSSAITEQSVPYAPSEDSQLHPNQRSPGGTRAVIFSDDFESGLGGWTVNGVSASTSDNHSPTHCAWFSGGNQYYIYRYENLQGYTGVSIDFWLHSDTDMEQGGSGADYFYLAVDPDGDGSFTVVDTYRRNDASSWTQITVDLSGYSMTSNFGIAFIADTTGGNENWRLDDVTLQGTPPGPVLSGGSVSPASGYRSTTFTYTVTYTNIDNYAPTTHNLVVGSNTYTMTKQDPSDNDYTDGCVYTYSLSGSAIAGINPLPYTASYHFEFSASNGNARLPATGESSGPVVDNQPPTAPSNPSPANGAIDQSTILTLSWSASTDGDGDTITYTVYCDQNNPPTTAVYSGIDTSTTVSGLDTTTTYYWYVVAEDGYGGSTASSVWSFVTSDISGPYLANGYVSPLTGDTTTVYTYYVTYYNDNNTAPTSAVVYIDGVSYAMTQYDPDDTDYTDGAVFIYNTTLEIGSAHTFYFLFHADGSDIRAPVLDGSSYTGPTVNPPSVESVSGREYEDEVVYMVLRYLGYEDSRPELKSSKVNLVLSSSNPVLGESYIIKSVIYNYGGTDVSANVRVLEGSTVIDTQTVYVSAGSYAPIETIWTPLFAGNRPITIKVDPANIVPEVFEFNNNATRLDPVVYFFYDDMENGASNWQHDTTLVRINGEGKLDYLNEPTSSNIDDNWGDSSGFNLNWATNNSNLWEEYHSQPFSYVMHERYVATRSPVDVCLDMDTSGSMKWNDPDDLRKSSARSFVDRMWYNTDRVAVYDFDSSVTRRQDFTYDLTKAKSAIGEMDSNGGTLLYDSAIDALNYIAANSRPDSVKALIILTDGQDSGSSHSLNDYKAVRDSYDGDPATETKIYVFTIQVIGGDDAILKDMCTQPWDEGPYYFKVDDASALDSIFQTIANIIQDAAQSATRGADNAEMSTRAAPLFSDNIPTNTLDTTKWPASSGDPNPSTTEAHSGTYSLEMEGTDSITSIPIDLSGESYATLEFWWRGWRGTPPSNDGSDGNEGGDRFYLDIYVNGGTWVNNYYIINNDCYIMSWRQEKIILPHEALWSGFRMRFHASTSSGDPSSDGYYLDDIELYSGLQVSQPQNMGDINPWDDGSTNNTDKYLETNPIDLRNVDHAELSFYQKYNLKTGANGGVLLVATSDSPSGPWTYKYIQADQPYTGNILVSEWFNHTDDYGTPMAWCWNGKSGKGTMDWEYISANLDDFVGHFVKVRFQYIHTTGGTGYGWIIDDVTVKASRDDDNPDYYGGPDNWVLNKTDMPGVFSHSGNYAWYCGDYSTDGDFKDGIDTSLYTRPIDLTSARTATLQAYFKFNIRTSSGRPPDGFRVEVSTDNGVNWVSLNLGLRAASGLSGNDSDASDGLIDGRSLTGIDAGNGWVTANSLTRLRTSLDGFVGNVIIIRFRIVTNAWEHHYQDSTAFRGFYVDDVVVSGYSIGATRSQGEENTTRSASNEGTVNVREADYPPQGNNQGPVRIPSTQKEAEVTTHTLRDAASRQTIVSTGRGQFVPQPPLTAVLMLLSISIVSLFYFLPAYGGDRE